MAKALFLLWAMWYISGPVAATIDVWDSPREEIRDVQRNAGGAVVLFAAAVCIGLMLLRRSSERLRFFASVIRQRLSPPAPPPLVEQPVLALISLALRLRFCFGSRTFLSSYPCADWTCAVGSARWSLSSSFLWTAGLNE